MVIHNEEKPFDCTDYVKQFSESKTLMQILGFHSSSSVIQVKLFICTHDVTFQSNQYLYQPLILIQYNTLIIVEYQSHLITLKSQNRIWKDRESSTSQTGKRSFICKEMFPRKVHQKTLTRETSPLLAQCVANMIHRSQVCEKGFSNSKALVKLYKINIMLMELQVYNSNGCSSTLQ